ncbi:MAG TPA: ABC transporter permease [Vicinamibacterales bacterium]
MLTDLLYRLRALFRRRQADADLDAELAFHLDQAARRHAQTGLTPEDARRRARIDLGGLDQVKDDTRDSWGVRLVESLAQDLTYAFRILRKSPGFTVAVVLSLALGIGANTAIFTLMDAVIWRLLPVTDPEALVVLQEREGRSTSTGFLYAPFRTLQQSASLIDIAGYTTAPINVIIDGPPEPSARGQLVTGDFFGILGVSAEIGRTIGRLDDRVPNAHPVAMLSHGYWERRFARDPAVIGRTVWLSSRPFTIVGVTPPGFFGAEVGTAPDLFLPLMMQPTVMPAFENLLEKPLVSRTWVKTIARPKRGVTIAQAAAELTSLSRSAANAGASGDPVAVRSIELLPAAQVSGLRRQFSEPLTVLLAMVGVVLLIACANTANLLLARAAARRPELGLRLALGCSRPRLMRQLIVEGLVLAGAGGLCGIVLAQWATQLLVAFMSSGRTPIALDLAPNLRILAFTVAVSFVTGLLFSLAPAARATRADLADSVKNIRAASARELRPRRILSIAQLALSLLLLVAAGLFVRTLQNANGGDRVTERRSVLVLKVEPKGSDQRGIPGTSERLDGIYGDLIARVRMIPGVENASMSNGIPTAPTSSMGALLKLPDGREYDVSQLMAYPSYFAVIGVPIVRGRDFTDRDRLASSPPVCIVNESFARLLFGDQDPLGRSCMSDLAPRRPGADRTRRRDEVPYVIAGVVKDSRYGNPNGEVQPLIYTTFLQTNTGRGQMVLHVRVRGPIGDVAARIREAVAAVDPMTPMFDIHTLEEEMNAALVERRLVALLAGVFGALALVLASVGLCGLVAFGVVQRTGELGIRLALGAPRAGVQWLILRDAMLLVLAGAAIGLPAALAVARVVSSRIPGLLFGLEATDPITIGGATALLLAVAGLAAYLPASRAARVDPMRVLRAE